METSPAKVRESTCRCGGAGTGVGEEHEEEEERWDVEPLDGNSSVPAVTNVFSLAAVAAEAALCLLDQLASERRLHLMQQQLCCTCIAALKSNVQADFFFFRMYHLLDSTQLFSCM